MSATKGLPTNVDAERFVLGSILLQGHLYEDVRSMLEVNDFSLEKHRRIYKRAGEVYERGEKIDRITVANELMRFSELESCDGLSYLTSLDDGLPQIPNIDSYVRLVKEKATLRGAIFACQHMINRCMTAEEDSEEILSAAEATIQKLAEDRRPSGSGWRNPGEVMSEYPGGIGAFLEPHKNATGIPTPWKPLTTSTGGFRKEELWIVAGRPSMGKSVAAMQMATMGARHLEVDHPGECAAVFSLEMSKESLVYRMLSSEGMVDAQRFRSGFLGSDERHKLNRAVGSIQDLPLFIDDTGARTVLAMRAALRKLSARIKPRLIFVDFLTEMDASTAESIRIGYSEIVKGLKRLAKDFKATVVLLAQLNRRCEDESRRPQLSDLKETGSVEEAADVVAFVHRWERYQKFRGQEHLRGLAELILAKQRNGPTGICKLVFLADNQRFEVQAGEDDLDPGRDS